MVLRDQHLQPLVDLHVGGVHERGEPPACEDPRGRPAEREEPRLEQEEPRHLRALHADGAEGADLPRSLADRDPEGVHDPDHHDEEEDGHEDAGEARDDLEYRVEKGDLVLPGGHVELLPGPVLGVHLHHELHPVGLRVVVHHPVARLAQVREQPGRDLRGSVRILEVEVDGPGGPVVELIQAAERLLWEEREDRGEDADAAHHSDHAHVHGVVHAAGRRRGEGERVADLDLEPLRLLVGEEDGVGLSEILELPLDELDHAPEPALLLDLDGGEDEVHRLGVGDRLHVPATSDRRVVQLGDEAAHVLHHLRPVRDERGGVPRGDLEEAAHVHVAAHERGGGLHHRAADPGDEAEEQDEEGRHRRDGAAEEEVAARVLEEVAAGDEEIRGEHDQSSDCIASRGVMRVARMAG